MNRIFVHAPDLMALSTAHNDSVKSYEYMQLADGTFLVAVEPEKVTAAEHLAGLGLAVLSQTDTVGSVRTIGKGRQLYGSLQPSWNILKADTVNGMLRKIKQATGNNAFNPEL